MSVERASSLEEIQTHTSIAAHDVTMGDVGTRTAANTNQSLSGNPPPSTTAAPSQQKKSANGGSSTQSHSQPAAQRQTKKVASTTTSKGDAAVTDGLSAREKERIRAREAQRNATARKKAILADLESKIAAMPQLMQREHEQQAKLSIKQELLNNLVKHKDEQIETLQTRKAILARAGFTQPEARTLPELVELLNLYVIKGASAMDELLQYAPGGYTDHLGPDGFAMEAPPLDILIQEYVELFTAARKCFEDAITAGEAHGPIKFQDRINADGSVKNTNADISQAMLELHKSAITGQETDGSKKALAILSADKNSTSTTPADKSPEEKSDGHGGVMLMYGGVKYHYTKDLLEGVVSAGNGLRLLRWSQTVFFPDSMMKFGVVDFTTGQPSPEYDNIERWLHVLRGTSLREEQIREVARLHYKYLQSVRPALRERAALVQHFRQWSGGNNTAMTLQEHLEASIALGECASALTQTIRVEYVAWCRLDAAIVHILDYPVQRGNMLIYSWPFLPNAVLLGACAALEMGLNPLEYTYDEGEEQRLFASASDIMDMVVS